MSDQPTPFTALTLRPYLREYITEQRSPSMRLAILSYTDEGVWVFPNKFVTYEDLAEFYIFEDNGRPCRPRNGDDPNG